MLKPEEGKAEPLIEALRKRGLSSPSEDPGSEPPASAMWRVESPEEDPGSAPPASVRRQPGKASAAPVPPTATNDPTEQPKAEEGGK